VGKRSLFSLNGVFVNQGIGKKRDERMVRRICNKMYREREKKKEI